MLARLFTRLAVSALFLLITAGCSIPINITKPDQPLRTSITTLDSNSTIGQTFVSRYDGLGGIKLFLDKPAQSNGTLYLHIRTAPDDPDDLRKTSLPLSGIGSAGNYPFSFAPIQNSTLQDYYFFLSFEGSGTVQVGSTAGENYLNGSMYVNHQPEDGQLTFSPIFLASYLYGGLAKEVMKWFGFLLISIFLFLIPGWGLLDFSWSGWSSLNWKEKLGFAGGLSLALYPILYLLAYILNLRLGSILAWIPGIVGILILIIRNRQAFLKGVNPKSWKFPAFSFTHLPWADLAFITLLASIILTRFWVVRSLDVPLWGDSYQHTMITQLLVDQRGLFQSWEPYAELKSFTYHFGFHTLVASFSWIANLSVVQATIWVGQIVNILAVICLYPLATRLVKNPWSGVVAVLFAGLLVPIPMRYLNWGRYTQLAGQAILPAAILIAWYLLDKKRLEWGMMILTWLVFAGLALTHYRILLFAVCFFPAYLIINICQHRVRSTLLRIFLVGVGSMLIFLPWLINLIPGGIAGNFVDQLTTPARQVPIDMLQYNATDNIFHYMSPLLWFGLLVIIFLSFYLREKNTILVILWWTIILLGTNPAWLGLPGTGIISNFALIIAVYIPAGVLYGTATGWFADWLETSEIEKKGQTKAPNRRSVFTSLLLFSLFLLLAIFSMRSRVNDLRVFEHTLVTRPDLRAFKWINENLPKDAHFLVNSFFAYGGTVSAGSDGGWWLPLLTGRMTSQPPLLYGIEAGSQPGFLNWTNQLVSEIQRKGLENPEVRQLLQDRKISYIYIGQRNGSVNSPDPLLKLGEIIVNRHFRPIYHQDHVWIFEFIP